MHISSVLMWVVNQPTTISEKVNQCNADDFFFTYVCVLVAYFEYSLCWDVSENPVSTFVCMCHKGCDIFTDLYIFN